MQERSGRDGLGIAEKAPVWRAAGTGRQTLVRQRQSDVPLTGAHGGLGKRPVHDVALGVAAADLLQIETDWQQEFDRLSVGAPVEGREPLDHRNADGAIEAGRFEAARRRLEHCL